MTGGENSCGCSREISTPPSVMPLAPAGFEARPKVPDIGSLLSGAREGDRESLGELLQQYRNYLMLVATTKFEKRLQPRVSPSDVVQETILNAYRHFGQFRGQTEKELLAWLRQILVRSLAKYVERYVLAAKRDVRKEVSIEQFAMDTEGSSMPIMSLVRGGGNTPSVEVQQREDAVVLAGRLAELPPQYREVIVLRNIQGLSFEEVAARLGRSLGATRMLWLRALETLRVLYRRAGQHAK